MPNLNAIPSGYITNQAEGALADSLSKATWIDLYIDLWRQAFGDEAPIQDILADAYARLSTLEANGIKDSGTLKRARTAWNHYRNGHYGKTAETLEKMAAKAAAADPAPAPAPESAADLVPACYVCNSAAVNPKGLAGAYGMCRRCYDQWQAAGGQVVQTFGNDGGPDYSGRQPARATMADLQAHAFCPNCGSVQPIAIYGALMGHGGTRHCTTCLTDVDAK